MLKIRKNDIVQATKGKDKGKKGKVISVVDGGERLLVEGINTVKKHKRQTRQDQKGGIVSIEKSIHVSNLALVCKSCSRPVRVGFKFLEDKSKVRYCKECKEAI